MQLQAQQIIEQIYYNLLNKFYFVRQKKVTGIVQVRTTCDGRAPKQQHS